MTAEFELPEEHIAVAAYLIWQSKGCPNGEDHQHWTMAREQLLITTIGALRQQVAQLQPQRLSDVWRMLETSRHAIQVVTEEATADALTSRPVRGRDQGADNLMLAPLSDAINRAINLGDYRLAATMFREGYGQVLAHETPGHEVHKGALAFDVARAYLQSWDFFAAMHYFELAQHETRLTTVDPAFSIYGFALFERNFWDAVDVNAAAHPIGIYQEFWGVPYNKASALDDYSQLGDDSKLAYIVASALRVRLQHIEDHSGWGGSDALRLGYWSLAADLARLLEVESKRRFKTPTGALPPDTLVPCLEGGFHHTSLGDISRELAIPILAAFPRKDPTGAKDAKTLYEDHFDPLLAVIRDGTRNPFDRICHALYLLGFTRNQVAHRLDKTSKLFGQLADARFLVDLFLTLCRTNEWKGI